jgi:hypothetical protein
LLERPNLRKTALCRNWISSSSCDKGKKCPYAHGGCELRVSNNCEAPPQIKYRGSSNNSHSSSETELNAEVFGNTRNPHYPRRTPRPAYMFEQLGHSETTQRGRVPTTGGHAWYSPSWVEYDAAYYILPAFTAYQYQHVQFPYKTHDRSTNCALQD